MPQQKYQGAFLRKYEQQANNHAGAFIRAFKKALGNVEGKRILDIGCGDGKITVKLALAGANVLGLDREKICIELCKKRYARQKNLSFTLGDARNLDKLPANSFDVVILNMVVPIIDTKMELKQIFGLISRVTKKGGVFLFSDLNPVCVMTKKFGHRRNTYSKNFSYFKDGSLFNAIIKLDSRNTIKFKDRHWKLETYSDLVTGSGFLIYKIIETEYGKSDSIVLQRLPVSEFIVFCCRKVK